MSNGDIMAVGSMIATNRLLPTVSDTAGITSIDHSELRKIAEDALDAAKYSYASVAANPEQDVRSNSLEAAFKEGFAAMKSRKDPSALAQIQEKAAKLTQASVETRLEMFGRYGQLASNEFIAQGFDRAHENLGDLDIDAKLLGIRTPTFAVRRGVLTATAAGILLPAEHLPTGFEDFEGDWEEATEKAVESDVYNVERLSEIWGPVYTGDPFADEFEAFEGQAVTDKLSFHIRRVKCVDETNPEWWGHDEIAIAGVSVDETGDTKKIGERYVGGGFDDGDQKWLNWHYHTFGLREGNTWPKRYAMTLLLAEKDWGGLSSVLNTVWQRVKEYVKGLIEKWIKAGLSQYLGPILAGWLGKIVAWVVGKLVEWIIKAFADDIFPPYVTSVRIPGFNYRWPGGRTSSPVRRAHFYGHKGHYYVDYYWRLYA